MIESILSALSDLVVPLAAIALIVDTGQTTEADIE